MTTAAGIRAMRARLLGPGDVPLATVMVVGAATWPRIIMFEGEPFLQRREGGDELVYAQEPCFRAGAPLEDLRGRTS